MLSVAEDEPSAEQKFRRIVFPAAVIHEFWLHIAVIQMLVLEDLVRDEIAQMD